MGAFCRRRRNERKRPDAKRRALRGRRPEILRRRATRRRQDRAMHEGARGPALARVSGGNEAARREGREGARGVQGRRPEILPGRQARRRTHRRVPEGPAGGASAGLRGGSPARAEVDARVVAKIMRSLKASGGCARREFLASGAALAGIAAAGPPLAQTAATHARGPRVWLDMDQAELDAAYDQIKYAPNLQQITRRYATDSEAVRSRLGAPRRLAYGSSAIGALGLYAAKEAGGSIDVLMHVGAWWT